MISRNIEASLEKPTNADSSTVKAADAVRIPNPPLNRYPFLSAETASNKIVSFDGFNDPSQPLNWPMKKKIVTTVLYGLTTAGATWLSSVYTAANKSISEEFHVTNEVSTLGLTLFLFGFVSLNCLQCSIILICVKFWSGPSCLGSSV
jgi:hypothetical protein